MIKGLKKYIGIIGTLGGDSGGDSGGGGGNWDVKSVWSKFKQENLPEIQISFSQTNQTLRYRICRLYVISLSITKVLIFFVECA